METKRCSRCKTVKPIEEFGPEKRSADQRRYSCKACDREKCAKYREANRDKLNQKSRERRRANPERDREYSRKYRQKFIWRTMLLHARKRAAKFGWDYDLDQHVETIKARLEPMLCEMTGVKLIPGAGTGSQGQRRWNTPSLDRKDPTKGYTIDNVRIVCWAMNAAMGTWGEDVLKELATRWLENK